MASLTQAFNKEFLDGILPTYGNPSDLGIRWNEGQKMFICEQYDSASGHLYYKGIRFCNQIVFVEKIGLYYNWTYIDGIEMYAFNGKRLELVQKRDYDKVYRKDKWVREESEDMLRQYIQGMLKLQNNMMPEELLEKEVKRIVDACYKSLLDEDFNVRITQILPQLEQR